MCEQKVNILGAVYTIRFCDVEEDEFLQKADGYTDETTKEIVIAKKRKDATIGNYKYYANKVLRHELVHAFMFESGLGVNWEHSSYGQEETTVDWMAYQMPKIMTVADSCAKWVDELYD